VYVPVRQPPHDAEGYHRRPPAAMTLEEAVFVDDAGVNEQALSDQD